MKIVFGTKGRLSVNGGPWMDVTASGFPAMPWGKHKGTPLHEVPASYLRWCLNNADSLDDSLRREIEEVLGLPIGSTKRGEASVPRAVPRDDALNQEIAALKNQIEYFRKLLAESQKTTVALNTENLKLNKKASNLLSECQSLRAALAESREEKPTDLQVFKRIIKQWFAAMSRRFHPDHGGDTKNQIIVNVCYNDLMERLTDG